MYKSLKYENRESVLKEGTIFDTYKCQLDNKLTRRPKLILNTSSEAYISIHDCLNCKTYRMKTNEMYIYHIKNNITYDVPYNCSNKLQKLYSYRLKEEINLINRMTTD